MRFTKIRLTGLPNSTTIEMPLVDVNPLATYVLKNISGFEPTPQNVAIARNRNMQGVYQGRTVTPRFPVVRIGLNPDYSVGQTVGDLRDILYGLLTPGIGDLITMEIINGSTVVAQCQGYLTKFEAVPFSKEQDVQFTMETLNPYLEAPSDVFPTYPASKSAPVINNIGTAPSGFRIRFNFTANAPNPFIFSRGGKKVQLAFPYLNLDQLTIDSRPGQRAILLYRPSTGLTYNQIYVMSADSEWLLLHGGSNTFAVNTSNYDFGALYYRPQFQGV